MSHTEEGISLRDIQEGRLVNLLLKPISYFSLKWMEELPNRLIQGSFGLIIITLFIIVFHVHLSFVLPSVINLFLIVLIIASAISVAQVYKMCLGFISFWTTEAYGIFQFSEMLLFIFGGYIAPLSFYPSIMSVISYILPYPYMIYLPIASISGFYTTQQLLLILCGQLVWLFILSQTYKMLWRNGVRMFTGVGQ